MIVVYNLARTAGKPIGDVYALFRNLVASNHS